MALPIIPIFPLLYAIISFVSYDKVPTEEIGTVATGMQPKVIINEQGVIQMVYGSEDNLYFIESTDRGKTFTKPALVASTPEGLMLGMGRGPQMANWGKSAVITAVNEKGNIYSWKLHTNSKKWEGPSRVNDVDTVAKEGFVALTKGKGNTLYTVWNDLRNGPNQLYGSISTDGGVTWRKNKLIYASPDTTICECCKVSMIYDNQDKVYVMWRNQLNGFRDMYLVALEDGFNKISSPIKLGKGTWKLKGCPMDGGNLSSDETGKITTIWRREGDILLCEPGKEEIKVGKGKTPAVTTSKLGTHVLWSENNEILAVPSNKNNVITLGKGRFPGIVSQDGLALAYWETEDKNIVVKPLEE